MENLIGKDTITNVVLVGVFLPEDDERGFEASLDELERLTETAGGKVFARLTQNRENPEPRTYIGPGKVTELRELCKNNDIDTVIFDCELSPSQIKNLEDDTELKVIDRSMLILDIFALHAVSGEGKLQVELAQLKYTVPRLTGKGSELSRLGGGIGTRGPGESKLETDRRHVKRRIDALREPLSRLEKNRATQRSQRKNSGIFSVAIVGYTNAGKSTLLNALTGAGILAEDKLFATLDTTTRKYALPSGEEILLTDTVGFIRNLPHHLIDAFKSTLEELKYADALLVVVDASDPECSAQIEVTEKLISELGAGALPVLYVFNKCDMGIRDIPVSPDGAKKERVFISAKTGEGLGEFEEKLEKLAHGGKKQLTFVFPHDGLSKKAILYKNSTVISEEYGDGGVTVVAVVDEKTEGQLKEYIK